MSKEGRPKRRRIWRKVSRKERERGWEGREGKGGEKVRKKDDKEEDKDVCC